MDERVSGESGVVAGGAYGGGDRDNAGRAGLGNSSRETPKGLWVFGYGSLMWRPGFPYDRKERARLRGFHRCFCITSTHHRGSERRPGLVLGLDAGGVCVGMALHVPGPHVAATRAYLTERELVYGVYREEYVPVTLATGEVVMALTYVAERTHPSYAGRLPPRVQARMIRGARGISGNNLDYLLTTLATLRSLAIDEDALERIAILAGPLFAREGVQVARPGVEALRRIEQRRPPVVTCLPKWQRRRFVFRRALRSGPNGSVNSFA